MVSDSVGRGQTHLRRVGLIAQHQDLQLVSLRVRSGLLLNHQHQIATAIRQIKQENEEQKQAEKLFYKNVLC